MYSFRDNPRQILAAGFPPPTRFTALYHTCITCIIYYFYYFYHVFCVDHVCPMYYIFSTYTHTIILLGRHLPPRSTGFTALFVTAESWISLLCGRCHAHSQKDRLLKGCSRVTESPLHNRVRYIFGVSVVQQWWRQNGLDLVFRERLKLSQAAI